ncbi:hypothetical protein [Daejeonella oryzae]|uniref:hypothetical protein n=1 Tax=Daejeonella oryzae TaxID=1122943 RepID=UPI00047D35EE|nr:hypothetical protein [Daejeonella oryzae]
MITKENETEKRANGINSLVSGKKKLIIEPGGNIKKAFLMERPFANQSWIVLNLLMTNIILIRAAGQAQEDSGLINLSFKSLDHGKPDIEYRNK